MFVQFEPVKHLNGRIGRIVQVYDQRLEVAFEDGSIEIVFPEDIVSRISDTEKLLLKYSNEKM